MIYYKACNLTQFLHLTCLEGPRGSCVGHMLWLVALRSSPYSARTPYSLSGNCPADRQTSSAFEPPAVPDCSERPETKKQAIIINIWSIIFFIQTEDPVIHQAFDVHPVLDR